ncbi:hypothetical protein EOL96_00190 [Candidatus Saccharibacteria bacterium]|nr:hypothetical protein [Candidatus Saccharibacteria bacterium]
MFNTEYFQFNWSDQSGIFDPEGFPDGITLIGLGGIGASLLPFLVTLGIRKFVIYDPDRVEPRNTSSQLLYKPEDTGRSKADVCAEYIDAYSAGQAEVEVHKELFLAGTEISTAVVISGVDNMDARRGIWSAIERQADTVQLYIDGRIGGVKYNCLIVDMIEDYGWYGDKWLGDNSAPLPCAQRAIVYPSGALACTILNTVVQWAAGEVLPRRVYEDKGNWGTQVVWKPKKKG